MCGEPVVVANLTLNMILAFFLLFVNDVFVLIADGADAEVWHCPNTSASELIKEIWEENRNLSSLFLLLNLDSDTLSGMYA